MLVGAGAIVVASPMSVPAAPVPITMPVETVTVTLSVETTPATTWLNQMGQLWGICRKITDDGEELDEVYRERIVDLIRGQYRDDDEPILISQS